MTIEEFMTTQENAVLVEVMPVNDPLDNPLIIHKIGLVKDVTSIGIRLAAIMNDFKQDSKFYLIGLSNMSYSEQEALNEASQRDQMQWFDDHVNQNATVDIIDELNLNIL